MLSRNGQIFEASGSGDGAISSVADAVLKVLRRMGYLARYDPILFG